MHTTMELLDAALARGISQRELSRKIGLSPSNLSVARIRGSLSPTAAGLIAEHLGESVEHWIAVAAIEAEHHNPHRERLKRLLHAIV